MSAIAHRPATAATSVVAAMTLIALIDNFVARIAELGGIWQFHLIRSAMAVPIILLIGRIMGWRLWPRRWWAMGLRGLFVSASMMLYFGSLAYLTVAEAAAGLFTAPIWVLLISIGWFGERVRLTRTMCVAAGFIGVLMVLRPWEGGMSAVAMMPLAAGLLYACGALATRRLCADEGALAILLIFFLFMAVWGALGCFVLEALAPEVPTGAGGFLLRGWETPDPEFLGLTAVQAVGSILGVGLLIRGYLLGEASFVAAFEYSLLICAAVWGWMLWRQIPDALAFVGIALIVVGGIVLAARGSAAISGS